MLRALSHYITALAGAGWYRWTGRTPSRSYQSMRYLYCLTEGRSNEVLSRLVGDVKPSSNRPSGCGILGDLSNDGLIEEAVRGLVRDGFFVFSARLPEITCEALMQ